MPDFDKDATIAEIKAQIAENPILLYMKGSPEQPKCGFSAKVVQVLAACDCEFAYVDILENPNIRATLPEYADWPTFPQLWVKGELIGGCDIVREMYDNDELQPILASVASAVDAEDEGFSEEEIVEVDEKDQGFSNK